jgi:NADPH:quinone reductase-like Zn-dependent oxidoreductase
MQINETNAIKTSSRPAQTTMKAVICPKYGDPEVLRITEVEKPVPKDDEILIKIRATTVTVADTRIRSFTVPAAAWLPARIVLGLLKPKQPILGAELAGEVETVGSNVKRFKKGDQVFAVSLRDMGAYAEYTCFNENELITLKPANSTFEEAAAIPIGARTALHYLRKVKIQPCQKILIYGASGSVGTYAIQLAKHFGAEVTSVCSADSFDLVKSLGSDKVINYMNKDFIEKLEMYDILFLAIDKFPFSTCNKFLKEDGFYINITSPIKNLEMIWTSITTKKKILMGENAEKSVEDLEFLKNLVEEGRLRSVIDRSYSLDEIVEAHRYVDKGHKKGNVVVRVG